MFTCRFDNCNIFNHVVLRGSITSWSNAALCAIAVNAFLMAAGSVAVAKPLITNSEENVSRPCPQGQDTSERLIAACDAALAEAGVSPRRNAPKC